MSDYVHIAVGDTVVTDEIGFGLNRLAVIKEINHAGLVVAEVLDTDGRRYQEEIEGTIPFPDGYDKYHKTFHRHWVLAVVSRDYRKRPAQEPENTFRDHYALRNKKSTPGRNRMEGDVLGLVCEALVRVNGLVVQGLDERRVHPLFYKTLPGVIEKQTYEFKGVTHTYGYVVNRKKFTTWVRKNYLKFLHTAAEDRAIKRQHDKEMEEDYYNELRLDYMDRQEKEDDASESSYRQYDCDWDYDGYFPSDYDPLPFPSTLAARMESLSEGVKVDLNAPIEGEVAL